MTHRQRPHSGTVTLGDDDQSGGMKAASSDDQIIAIVNGQIITARDVDDRARLFVLSTGLPVTDQVFRRMRGQIVHQMIDERLKMQEMLQRQVLVSPREISDAIAGIEQRNGMSPNMLRNKLAEDGMSLTTLVDQLRVQIGWMQVLRMNLGPASRVTPQQIAQREKGLQKDAGKAQYFMSEVFIPVLDALHDQPERTFTETIIAELRKGAPFPLVAAQFSQDPSALEGGSLGWVEEDRLDPEVVDVIRQMPDQAISNPIRVPGGFVIATVHQRRTVGKQMATVLNLRQVFFPFTEPLNPQMPTAKQRDALQGAIHLMQTAHDCKTMETVNAQQGTVRPSNPGLQVESQLQPAIKAILGKLPLNRATRPMVSPSGIVVLMVCSREQRNLAQQSPGQVADQMMSERIEQAAQQLQRSLERRAVITVRKAGQRLASQGQAKTPNTSAHGRGASPRAHHRSHS
ncbi:peptidylprolyl isomerase [Formicincola oecophyllae]|uniref:Parvulin-like PPIase n=1 Tax=Formicincola oecophyllae TaxID=2558361 RepID=A0A4Y6U954_9PROT|nr:peptidylprolyl isomerase [Formicincola oecophyllae]QDH13098.1 peptidylprolyl isomerase [Formicincola oecophyllae]